MHRTSGRTGGIYFNHNGDFSGTLQINIQDGTHWEYGQGPIYEFVEPIPPPQGYGKFSIVPKGYHVIRVPFRDIKGIVAEYVRRTQIEKLENMSDDEVLDLITIADKVSNGG